MRTVILFISMLLSCYGVSAVNPFDIDTFKLKKENGHYLFEASINNEINGKFLLESGIHVMLMDSLFAIGNEKDLGLDFIEIKGNEKMNLGGKVYNITHKANGTMRLGNNTQYKGEIFVLSNYGSYYDLAVPIQNIFHMEDNSRILKLDMRDSVFQVLSRERFNTESHNYTTADIHYDTYMNMPAVRSSLSFGIGGERYTLSGDFVLDLGNAAFLFLLKQSSVVEDFLRNNPDIKWQKAYNKKGILIAEAISADQNTLCGRTFGKQVIAITATLPRFTSAGSIGLKFFEGNVSIFDFDESVLYSY